METSKGAWKEERISAEKIGSMANELLCDTFIFLVSADQCVEIMRSGWGGVGGEGPYVLFRRGLSYVLNMSTV